MLIESVSYYEWRSAPIELDVDEEMARLIVENLKVEAMEAVSDGNFSKAGDMIRSIDVLTTKIDKLAEVKAEKEQVEGAGLSLITELAIAKKHVMELFGEENREKAEEIFKSAEKVADFIEENHKVVN